MIDDEYQCAMCGEIFGLVRNEEWSNEKAKDEFAKLFPDSNLENADRVCDDCWEKIKPNSPIRFLN